MIKRILFILATMATLMAQAETPLRVKLQPFDQMVKIDGYLTDDVWENATKITDFYTFLPVDGMKAEERTAVLLGYDQANLYIAVICFYEDNSLIRASITRRDAIFNDDFVIIYLDTFNDGQHAYQFGFNPYGIQADGIFTEQVGEDFKPDFLLESRGRLFSKGYIVEARIPFSSLNFPDKDVMEWGMSCFRRTQHNGKDIIWPRIVPRQTEFIGQFARLSDIKNIEGGRILEILPEVTALRNDLRHGNTLDNGAIEEELGLNLNFGITSALKVHLALNPDFSQVESDATRIDVNRRFPLQYSEKRPFFLEELELFQTPIEAVYTRQMVDPLFATKLSGRIGDYSVGFISEVEQYASDNEVFGFFKPIDNDRRKPMFNNILRIKRNVGRSQEAGILITDRELDGTFNRLAGADARLTLGQNWILKMQGLYSNTKDSDQPIRDGHGAYLNLWRGGPGLNMQLFYNELSPDFRADNGFLYRTDIRQPAIMFWQDFPFPKGAIQQISPTIYTSRVWNYEGQAIDDYIIPSLEVKFAKNTTATLDYTYQMTRWNDRKHIYPQASIDIDNATLSWLETGVYYRFGEDIYFFGNPAFIGDGNYLSGYLTLKTKTVNTRLSLSRYTFDGQRGNLNYEIVQDIYRFRFIWQLHRYFALRIILEENEINGTNTYPDGSNIDANILFSYTPSPGTVFYLGANGLFNRYNNYESGWPWPVQNKRLDARGVFFKLSYLFQY